jgi:hypothetical protein
MGVFVGLGLWRVLEGWRSDHVNSCLLYLLVQGGVKWEVHCRGEPLPSSPRSAECDGSSASQQECEGTTLVPPSPQPAA